MKGIFRNLRKLTEDMQLSDEDGKSSSIVLDSSSISGEKISPTMYNYSSQGNRYKYLTVNEELKKIDESITHFSSSGKSPSKKVHFSLTKVNEIDSDDQFGAE